MSPVYKPKIIYKNQAALFLPLICFSLDKSFEDSSGGQVCYLEEVRVFDLPYLTLFCCATQSSLDYADVHNSPQPQCVNIRKH